MIKIIFWLILVFSHFTTPVTVDCRQASPYTNTNIIVYFDFIPQNKMGIYCWMTDDYSFNCSWWIPCGPGIEIHYLFNYSV